MPLILHIYKLLSSPKEVLLDFPVAAVYACTNLFELVFRDLEACPVWSTVNVIHQGAATVIIHADIYPIYWPVRRIDWFFCNSTGKVSSAKAVILIDCKERRRFTRPRCRWRECFVISSRACRELWTLPWKKCSTTSKTPPEVALVIPVS